MKQGSSKDQRMKYNMFRVSSLVLLLSQASNSKAKENQGTIIIQTFMCSAFPPSNQLSSLGLRQVTTSSSLISHHAQMKWWNCSCESAISFEN